MAQFSLPQNSKIEVGKYFKDKTNSKNIRKINVYRWDPTDGKNPRVDTFEIDIDNCGPKVLDILIKIKNEIDPSLTFRRSCAHGVCGSCAMNVDGVNTLSCIKSHNDMLNFFNIEGTDVSKWTEVDNIAFKYNRLVMFNPFLWHSQGDLFGNDLEDARLIQLFFFHGED